MDKNYDLWLFLDLENYGDGRAAKTLDKAVRKTPEFRGTNGKRLYFEFANKFDKSNFIATVMMELQRQDYRCQFVEENDSNIPKQRQHGSIKERLAIANRKHSQRGIRGNTPRNR